MTLALLLTAVTGAWAQSYEAKVFDVPALWTGDETYLSAADLPKDFVQITKDEAKALAVPDGNVILIYGFEGEKVKEMLLMSGTLIDETEAPEARAMFRQYQTESNAIICYTAAADPNAITVTPVTGKTNEWTFTMPAFDVEIAPIYAPTAQWAKVEKEDQLPTAVEGVFAGTEDAIVNAGTVAKIGETEKVQGEVMYFATTDAEMTAEKAAAAEGWLSTLPTAAGYDDAQTVYVWYYIKGADTPQGETATAENTFNDSEICTTPIEVTLLSNKFDIQFNAANANTIEAGKATVKVGETAAEVKEGKLTGVKMDSKVTITAKDGYKFRKAEAKKKSAAAPTTTVTWNSSNVFNSAHEDVELSKWSPTPLSYEGITISFSGTKASSFQAYDEDDYIGSLICYGNNGDSFTFTAPSGKKFCKIEIINNGFIVFANYGDWTRDADNKIVWSGTAANTVTLGSVYTSADNLNSIVFYLSE